MIEEDDAKLAAVRGAAVEIPGDGRELGHRRAVAPEARSSWSCRSGPPTRPRARAGSSAAAISRAPLLSRPTTRVACASTSIRASTWRIRATLSAKSETTIELAARGDRAVAADHRPQRLDRGGGVDVPDPENLGDEARRRSPAARPARVAAAPATGWIRKRPARAPAPRRSRWRAASRGTARNIRSATSGRSVTTETRPCTPGSMMKVRPVTREASWMKARMSASRRFSTCCADAGVTAAQASARAIKARFTGSPSPSGAPPARPDRPSP